MTHASLPPSVARWHDPIAYLALLITLFVALRPAPLDSTTVTFVLLGALTCYMCLCEFIAAKPHFPTNPTATTPLRTRIAVKWLGIMAVVGLSLFLWWLVPFYHRPYYKPILILGLQFFPILGLLLLPYLYYTERTLGEARDYAWEFGQLCLGRIRGRQWVQVRNGALSMLVRTIFLPLNFCFVLNSISNMRQRDFSILLAEPTPQSHALMMSIIYMLLIFAIIPGYLFSFRLLKTHTRTIDRSWFGWVVCLACYPPFAAGIFGSWFAYNVVRFEEPFMKPWIYLLTDHTMLLYAVGIGILLSEIVHYWAEAVIGIRSSNLTHRGIITNSIFRYMRHPVYFSKCVGWFLIALPFAMAPTTLEAFRVMVLFGGVCLIYYLRSISEERILSEDPDYVAYALHLDKHGWLACIGRVLPFVTFEWRHKHWHQKYPLP